MKEIACQFGENNRLSGIMTRADLSTTNHALVFISVGFEAKYGLYRLHAQIARMAAEHGLDSFRFDFGDLGYSQPVSSIKSLEERKTDEIKSALDYVQSTFNIDRFILIGHCSAAEDSFRYADLDDRVHGIIMIDTFAYDTPRKKSVMYFERLKRLTLRIVYSFNPCPIMPQNQNLNITPLVRYSYMKKAESQSILANLLKRKIKLHFIYTRGMVNIFTHKSQLWKMFPELKRYPNVALDFFPTMGHSQMLEEERQCLVQVIEKRLLTMYIDANQIPNKLSEKIRSPFN